MGTNAIIVLALGGVYIIAIFLLSYFVSQPMDKPQPSYIAYFSRLTNGT
jgi:hypothetical protein